MIHCGVGKGRQNLKSAGSSAFSKLVQKLTAPLAYGATDVDLITGTETSPNITQSETFTTANPDNPNEIVVAYNDSRGVNAGPLRHLLGASVSTRWRHSPSPVSPTPAVKVLFRQYLWRSGCSVQQANSGLGLLSGSMATRRLHPGRV